LAAPKDTQSDVELLFSHVGIERLSWWCTKRCRFQSRNWKI